MTTTMLTDLFHAIPLLKELHSSTSDIYPLLKKVARIEIEPLFRCDAAKGNSFGPFGKLIFPYVNMGAVDSLNLFDIDELIIFSFYLLNRNKYKCVADIGANIGLHSVLLSKCGYEVRSYEPDPKHFEILERNLHLNDCTGVEVFNSAVSSTDGTMEFIRVLGNTTGSHIAGAKDNPYGKLEKFPVEVTSIKPILQWADLIKLDAEGHEKDILSVTTSNDWINTDALVEVSNENNAAVLFEHFNKININLFAQKKNWSKVCKLSDMPNSYKEGTLFITNKKSMSWQADVNDGCKDGEI